MRNLTYFLATLVLSSLASITALAGGKFRSSTDEFRPGGLTVSLTTSRLQVLQSGLPEPSPTARRRQARRGFERPASPDSFVASAVVANASGATVNFSFPDAASADRKWTFRVFDDAGNLVWISDQEVVGAQVITEAKLEPRRTWRRTIRIPLIIDDVPLPAGTYHLEASIDADKTLHASTFFEVIALPMPPGDNSGIRGQVLKEILPSTADHAFEPAAGALVTVQQIGGEDRPTVRRPLFWSLRADEQGVFSVPMPAGRYRVTASLPPSLVANGANPVFPPKSVEVTVAAGVFSEVTLRLETQRPPAERGAIRGLVLIGPVTPVEIEGVPNERPLPGAHVVIEQLDVPDGQAPFRWNGRAGDGGRFELAAPAGRYVVVASGAEPGRLPVPAREEIVVTAGKATEVTLHLDSGIR